jgi:hypothetical protein
MTPRGRAKLLLWISRIALVILAFALLAVAPFCYCARYYIALAVAGIIPLLCGPELYRCFGAYILTALLFAAGEHYAA